MESGIREDRVHKEWESKCLVKGHRTICPGMFVVIRVGPMRAIEPLLQKFNVDQLARGAWKIKLNDSTRGL